MEKIVTKIGDVIIERRVSKPQQTKEAAAGSNLQQQNVPQIQIIPKTDDPARPLPQYNLTTESFLTNKNVTRAAPIGVSQGTTTQGALFDLKTASNQLEPTNADPAKSQELVAHKDVTFQNAPNLQKEAEESGMNLPKVPSFDGAQLSKSGPDLSRLVGISIERKKRVVPESQNQTDFPKPSLSVDIKKIPFPHHEIKQEVVDEEIDDSFEEEEYEDEAVTLEDDAEEAEENKKHSLTDEQETMEPEIALIEDEEEIIPKEEPQEELKEEMEIKEERDIKQEVDEEKESDINDLACTDLVELMQKGEIEGEIEDVKDEEMMTDSENKKDNKRKASEEREEGESEKDGEEKQEENKDGVPAKKRKKKKSEKGEDDNENKEDEENEDDEDDEDEDEDEEGKDKNIDKSKVTNANLRKNIREVMDETQLDEATLAAQRQEAERLKRLQEQQRIIREVQRQIALNRQNQKSQNKVLSLLQGNSQTSILKTSSSTSQSQGSQAKSANSVLVKLSNGEQTSLNNRRMMELLKNSKNKTLLGKPPIAKTLLKQGMVTPSVSIAPVIKKEPVDDEKKKKKGDVVTLSSDSEDDCIVLSDEDESEPEEDPTNSGMHTNDKYNLPDEKGRIVVNVGHPESESDLYLAPQIARVIKPHQIGGIRFLYDNVIESIERYQNSAGFGCILAHSMGLGKTLQIVSFSDIFLRYTPAKTILCIMPINTIQNWLAEFNMWLPKESTAEDVRCREFDLFIVNESLKNINSRAKVILDWHKSGGVLLMGYELFRLLSLKKSYKSKKKKKDPEEEDAKQKELIEEVYSALVVPGPDLVICDEGHRIKNSHATTSQALKQIKTKRRIVLTGYPLQNNLLEYWCMVDFVRPNYLGTKTEFSNMFERPIQNGQCIDSTPQDKRLMRYRAHVLHSLLEGFVQRRSHAVLQSALPEKEEYVLLLRFTPFQRKLYDTFMNEVVRTVAVPNPLKAFAVCCKIWNHPDVLYNFLKKKGEEIDLDLEEALPPSLQIPQYPYGQTIGSDGMNQPPMSGTTPWPKRGPGSRGGKVRQPNPRKVGRGRKPAATISPNVMGEKGPHEGEGINPGQYPPNENFPNHHDRMENFQGRPYSQNQFGGYNNDYNGQSGGYHNPSYSKNPLNNLEDMSGSNYHSKRYFPQQNDSGSQNQYGNQNFESGHSEPNFNPNNSNDSNPLNSSFESNLNSSDSNYNQNESGKPFGYGQDYSSDFYGNSNFPNQNSNYPADTKSTGFQSNYFQTSGFRNSENFDYQSSSSNMSTGFPAYERSQNFQSSGASQTFQGNTAPNFQNTSNSQNMGGQSSGFPNSSNTQTVQGGQTPNFQNSTPNFPTSSGPTFQNTHGSQRVAGGQTANYQNTTQGSNFQDSNSNSNSSFQASYQSSDANCSSGNFIGQNPGQNFQGQSSGSNFQDRNSESSFQSQNSGANFQGRNAESNFQSQNSGLNFQGRSSESNFPGQNAGSSFQSRSSESNFPGQNARSSFQGRSSESNFPGQNAGSSFQGRAPESNFPGPNSGSNFQGRNPESNFQSQNSGSNFQGRNSESNFQAQNSGSNFPSRNTETNFQGQNSETNYQGQNSGSNFQTPSSGSNFQSQNSGPNFQGQNSGSNFQNQSSGTNFQNQNSGTSFQGNNPNFDRSGSFQGNNYEQGFWPQSNWGYPEASKGSTEFQSNNTTNDYMQQKFNSFEAGQESKSEEKVQCNSDTMYNKTDCDFPSFGKTENETKFPEFDEEKVSKPKEEEEEKKEDVKNVAEIVKKEEPLPYEWAVDLFKTYVTGIIENSSKMEVFFHIVTESIKLGDRLLVFSQSLLTLDLIEDYLHRQNVPDKDEAWAKSRNYFRLDGSTPGLEREKLINEFNGNPNVYLFLVSTRAGSLGINLVGANRVVVFDASWNPCHDTQAVCRVYRYGQRKPCFVYRLVMDSCLEKKIYDRQVNKQGMADRVVDELNPDAHLSIKEVTNLCWDDQEDTTVKDFSHLKDKYNDEIIKVLLERCSKVLSKEPFQHESLLIDRKEKKLSQAEKRLAKRSYELEKQAANQPKNIYSFFPNTGQRTFAKPIASVRPMQSEIATRGINSQLQNRSKWIPAEVWQKQGMSAQEMTLPLDVVIPTSSPEKTSIVLKAGQRVMVLKSPKGIYMQLENGKIIAIRSAFKVGQNGPGGSNKSDDAKKEGGTTITPSTKALGASAKITPTARPGLMKGQQQPFLKPFSKLPDKKPPVNMALARSRQIMGKAKPFMLNKKFENTTTDVKPKMVTGKTNFANQDEKPNPGEQLAPEKPAKEENPPANEKNEPSAEKISFSNDRVNEPSEEKTEEKQEEKPEVTDSLETLRKVTESISDPPKAEKNLNILEGVEGEPKYPQANPVKSYRHTFPSQIKPNVPVVEEKKKESNPESVESKPEENTTSQQQGNENVQNWLMNQSYPPMDPYGNYFPGYYGFGPGPAPMMPPYDGFYPPSNYGHPMGRNSPMIPPHGKQQPAENVKSNVPQTQPPISQSVQNSSATRNPPAVNTPPIYPPYPNPYPYPYNYPGNPSFNNQGFPYPNQNQSSQQSSSINPPTASSTTSTQNQPSSYDNSMYSAFHRPDAPFQTPDSSYPSPYPRPPYPSSGTPGFFPYNHPYPNYPYGPNFNPYMHPAGYGYPMQNPPPVNSQSLSSSTEGTVGSNSNSGNS